MNERIKELEKQCWQSTQTEPYALFDVKKFAELIVQDCMDVVDGYTKSRTFDTHYDAVEQIEALFGIKHNGVEE